MKLYGSIISPYVARVVYAARLKGLSLEAEMPAGGIKTPEFLALNPLGKMPALQTESGVVAESMVILDYLEDAHPNPPLLSTDSFERARERLLGRIVDLYVMPCGNVFFGNLNPEKRNAEAIETATKNYLKSLQQLEHFMAEGPYAHGSSAGYADCALLPCLHMMTIVTSLCGINDVYAATPKLSRWWQTVTADSQLAPWITHYEQGFTAFLQGRR